MRVAMIRDRLVSYLPLKAGETVYLPDGKVRTSEYRRMPSCIGLPNKRILAFPTGTRRLENLVAGMRHRVGETAETGSRPRR